MKESTVTTELLDHAIFRMEESLERIRKCLDQLTEEEVWQRPNAASNSMGNLVLHLCGNITQYVLSALGGRNDERTRDEEFSAEGGFSKEELMSRLDATIKAAIETIRRAEQQDLVKKRPVQCYEFSAVGIIIHVVEHLSYHTGQIAFWTKLLKGKDLGFYANVDLNKKNS